MRTGVILIFVAGFTLAGFGQNGTLKTFTSQPNVKDFSKSGSLFSTKPIHKIDAKQSLRSILFTPKVNLGKKSEMAFFCRIEDKIARNSKVNFKFRLGSVSYVDALEGKGYFEALSYSKATNFRMSRQ